MFKDYLNQKFKINLQYIKDLSFENPNAPKIFGDNQKAPDIDNPLERLNFRLCIADEPVIITWFGVRLHISLWPTQHLYYNGSAWVNEYDYDIGKRVPFTKTDGTTTTIALVNNKDMTTINGFLDHTVSQSYYLPFTIAAGTAVTTIRPGHMPSLDGI